MEEVKERNMSQLRDGSFGRLESHEGGIPVYWRTVRMPDLGGGDDEDEAELMPALQGVRSRKIENNKLSCRRIGPDVRGRYIIFAIFCQGFLANSPKTPFVSVYWRPLPDQNIFKAISSARIIYIVDATT
jgi:hypothetical protein